MIEVVKCNELHRFKVLPKRWILERTFAWLNWFRRLSKDYELLRTRRASSLVLQLENKGCCSRVCHSA